MGHRKSSLASEGRAQPTTITTNSTLRPGVLRRAGAVLGTVGAALDGRPKTNACIGRKIDELPET